MDDFIEFELEELSDEEWLAALEAGAAEEIPWGGDVDLWDHDLWPDPPF